MNILYLSFYFEPDLSAGSFRNSTLAKELSKQVGDNSFIDVVTSQPNRYTTFKIKAESKESIGNMTIHRIQLPEHKSGMIDQANSFRTYFVQTLKITKKKKYDLVFASSSRLFTAYLGYVIASKQNIPLYLDIRDIFVDTMDDVLKNRALKTLVLPFLRIIEKKTFFYASHINLISEGFKPYFAKYSQARFSNFTNGIDDIFLNNKIVREEEELQSIKQETTKETFTITYAGNIGEGQGLHKIIPQAAARLGNKYRFKVVGDGGVKGLLENELKQFNVSNVELLPPVSRERLLEIYNESDFLFLHLNNYKAFEKVLPSKIFELATFNKPIIAGVGGYAKKFIQENVDNVILFNPCDADSMVSKIKNYEYKNVERQEFIHKFSRDNINKEMARSILSYL